MTTYMQKHMDCELNLWLLIVLTFARYLHRLAQYLQTFCVQVFISRRKRWVQPIYRWIFSFFRRFDTQTPGRSWLKLTTNLSPNINESNEGSTTYSVRLIYIRIPKYDCECVDLNKLINYSSPPTPIFL